MVSSATMVSKFRSAMRDVAEPFLWSDDAVIGYLNQARLELCYRAWGISDTIDLTFSDGLLVEYPRYILKIKAAYNAANGRAIPLRAYTEVSDPFSPRTSGNPSCLLTGLEEGKLKAYPVPSTPVTVRLVVLRYPKVFVSAVDTQDIEMGDEAVAGLLYWMRHEAYSQEDSETYDRGQADYFYNKFTAFADGYRRMHERRETQNHVVQLPTGGYW